MTAAQLFGDHLDHFRRHLLDQHHGDGTVRQYMRCISVLAELTQLEKIALDDLNLAHALALVAKTGWINRRRTYAAFMATRFIRFLTEHGVGKPPLPPAAEEIAKAVQGRPSAQPHADRCVRSDRPDTARPHFSRSSNRSDHAARAEMAL